MKDTESLFTPVMTRALTEQQARSLTLACLSLAEQVHKEDPHRAPRRALHGLEQLRVMVLSAQAAMVDVCRDQSVTWEEIAEQVGITRQAAMQRWS